MNLSEEIERLARLRNSGAISPAQYKRAVDQLLTADTAPRPQSPGYWPSQQMGRPRPAPGQQWVAAPPPQQMQYRGIPPGPPQPLGYRQPAYRYRNTSHTFTILGSICGVIAFAFFPVIFGPVGIVFAIVAANQKEENWGIALGIAIAGMALGMIIGALVWGSMFIDDSNIYSDVTAAPRLLRLAG